MPNAAGWLGQALGKLFTNALKNPRWIASEAGGIAITTLVRNPIGKTVYAKLHGHFHHDGGKLGDHYKDQEGNEYIVTGGKKFGYHAPTDKFYAADAA